MAICWTIAGSDSGGGAGIQADLRTFHQLGVHGCCAIVGLTAQNTKAVRAVSFPEMSMIEAQLNALREDLPAQAIKTGMLGRADIMVLVAKYLENLKAPLVVDPVMVATSGGVLMAPEAKKALVEKLLPLATVVTPNLKEAEVLAGMTLKHPDSLPKAAARILELGPESVWMKGGHMEGPFALDYWTNGTQELWLSSKRLDVVHTHGSGCTLSSALAALLAQGYAMDDALVIAKAYIAQAIRLAGPIGSGPGPVFQGPWPQAPQDLPKLGPTIESVSDVAPAFPDTGEAPLGFYPIVDSAAWLERLLPLGVTTAQLRIKDLTGSALEQEIATAIQIGKAHQTRLFINDYWQLALKHNAYGVHLGQEDLETADLELLARSGLRLGVSTHCYTEVARALAIRPSYMAIGPIFSTQTKIMRFGPQGIEALRRWRKSLTYPLVAIGGIKLDRAQEVLEAGADSLAVITAVTEAADPEAETRRWLALF